MKKIFMALMFAIISVSMIGTADAKRLGGGSSFGKQSFSAQRQMQSPRPAQAPTSPNAAPAGAAGAAGAAAKSASPWKGILGGALLGLGLGALLSHLGIGGALASMISTILMIAIIFAAIMFVMKMLRRKTDNTQSPAYASGNTDYSNNYNNSYSNNSTSTPEIGSAIAKNAAPDYAQNNSMGGTSSTGTDYNNGYGIPAGFDAVGFARQAKVSFIRLQAAWDKADLDDIREFTTPEMFAEIKMQVSERGATENHTDVVSIDAEVLGVETVGNEYIASIRFFGFIKEEENTSPAQFQEIWNLTKPINGNGGWLLAGIQQIPV